MDGKITQAKNRIKNLNPKKASIAVSTALIMLAGVFFIGSSLGAFNADNSALNSKTISFQVNGTALNTSGNGTVNLGIATGEKLNFGRIPVDASSTKFLSINAREKAYISINAEGNVSEALVFEKNHYFKGKKEIQIRFDPETAETFEGTVNVNVKTAENEVGSTWLDIKSRVY